MHDDDIIRIRTMVIVCSTLESKMTAIMQYDASEYCMNMQYRFSVLFGQMGIVSKEIERINDMETREERIRPENQ